MKRAKVLFAWLTVTAILGAVAAFGVIDGSRYADGYTPIVFPNITSSDTLESVRHLGLYKEITYYIKITSRRFAGMGANDTVQAKLCFSSDDTTYTNASSTGATLTYTTAGTWAIVYDYLSSTRFTRLEFPNIATADSLTVAVKAVISSRVR